MLTVSLLRSVVVSGVIGSGVLLAILLLLPVYRWAGRRRRRAVLGELEVYWAALRSRMETGEELPMPPGRVRRAGMDLLQQRMLEAMERETDGETRCRLSALCARLGLVQREMRRCRSIRRRARMDAAYKLGVMRSGRAVPVLLAMLYACEFGSGAWVVARAVARCARDLDDMRTMTLYMLRYGTAVYLPLLMEILREAPVDCGPLWVGFLEEDHPQLKQLALIGLGAGPASVALRERIGWDRLFSSPDKEIRIKALRLYLRWMAPAAPRKQVFEWAHHADWEIRIAVISTLAELASPTWTDVLKDALCDESWWVRYRSAAGLAALGAPGMTALREVAATTTDRFGRDMAYDVLHMTQLYQEQKRVRAGRPPGGQLSTPAPGRG